MVFVVAMLKHRQFCYASYMDKMIRKFWTHVDKTPSCWNWKLWLDRDGYGQYFTSYKPNQVRKRAHRYAWEITYGNIPKGMLICHHCDNRACVRPNHLFIGTNKDNILDMMKKGRHVKVSIPGELNHHSKLKNKDIIQIRKLYKTGKFTQKQLAKKFNTFQGPISSIVLRKTWKHI